MMNKVNNASKINTEDRDMTAQDLIVNGDDAFTADAYERRFLTADAAWQRAAKSRKATSARRAAFTRAFLSTYPEHLREHVRFGMQAARRAGATFASVDVAYGAECGSVEHSAAVDGYSFAATYW